MAEAINQELLEAFFEDARDVLEEWERVSLELKPGQDVKAYEPILRCAHNLKGSAGMTGLSVLHAKIHHIEDYLVKLRDLGRGPDATVVRVLLDIEKMLRSWMTGLKKDPTHVEDIRTIVEQLTALVAMREGDAPQAETEESLTADHPQAEKKPTKVTPKTTTARKMAPEKTTRGDETLRVAVAKLDHLIQLVGEISLHQAILDRASHENKLNAPDMRAIIDLKTKLTQDLQDAALSLRMFPIRVFLKKAKRVVRETATLLNRQVKIDRRGEEVALDKLVVDGMLDPLIHIARNAVDHGIEAPEDRILAGKSPQGNIRISAENTAAGVTVQFEDDGKGIDGEKVFKKAVEKGLLPAEEILNSDGKLQLIFLPGLSTAEKVTEVSGRGVGMDVVGDTVKRMGGRIEISSQVGKGTKLTITLPTNLSILDALIVRVNGCQYAVPNQDLAEVVNLRDFDIQNINGSEAQVIYLRGKVVPVEDMSAFLDQKQEVVNADSSAVASPVAAATAIVNAKRPRPAIIAQYRDEPLALSVDRVIGQQQIFVRPIIGHLSTISFYGGSTILSDGEPTIILNLPEMARRYFTSH